MYANIDFIKVAEEDLKTKILALIEGKSNAQLFDILYSLTELENADIKLSAEQEKIYTGLVTYFKDNGVEIPFPVEI